MNSVPTEEWKVIKGVTVYRAPRGTTPDGRTKWMYFAQVPYQDCMAQIKSETQQGITSQIGRMRNGLRPTDCRLCINHMIETDISPEHCSEGMDTNLCNGGCIGVFGCPKFKRSV